MAELTLLGNYKSIMVDVTGDVVDRSFVNRGNIHGFYFAGVSDYDADGLLAAGKVQGQAVVEGGGRAAIVYMCDYARINKVAAASRDFAPGQAVYFDVDEDEATDVAASNEFIGTAIHAAGATDTTVDFILAGHLTPAPA